MRPPSAARPEAEADRRATLLVGAGAAVAVAFLASMLFATGGRFVPQVVDLYLTCQYARAMAEGHPFQYNAGEPASTGATASPPWSGPSATTVPSPGCTSPPATATARSGSGGA